MTNPNPPGTPGWHEWDAANIVHGMHQRQFDTTGYGGLGYDPVTGRTFISVNQGSREAAEAVLREQSPAIDFCTKHRGFVALAVAGDGRYALQAWDSSWVAMHRAIQATGDPGASVVAVMSTTSGRLDVATEWRRGEVSAQGRAALMGELGRAGKGFLWVAVCLVILAITGFNPGAGLVLFIIVAVVLLVRRGRRRSR